MPVGPYEDHAACVADNGDLDDPDAFCAWLENHASQLGTSEHSGAVVTLLPSVSDAERLSVDGGDAADDLHVTLAWLGDTEGDPAPAQPFEVVARAVAEKLYAGAGVPIVADVFAHAVFNPDDDERDPAVVLLLQSEPLADIRTAVVEAAGDASSFPVWVPHLTLGYNLDQLDEAAAVARMGPVTFDRVAVSYGAEQAMTINLGDEPMTASSTTTRTRGRRLRVVNGARTVTASTCGPCTQTFVDDELPEPPDLGSVAGMDTGQRWRGVLAVEDAPTGDGRMFEAGSMRWEDLPIPLRWVREDEGEHLGAVVVGRIEEIWRDGSEIRARGSFDAESDDAREAARMVREQLQRGVSVDVDDADMEIRIAEDVLDEMEQPIPIDDEPAEAEEEPDDREVDAEGRVTVVKFEADDELMVFTDARIRAATIVATPAFVEAMLEIDDEPAEAEEEEPADEADELTAAAFVAPPADWFSDPKLDGPSALTVTDEGRVFGHLAQWGTCHVGFAHDCVTPPRSASGYAYFRTGAVRAADGSTVPTGRITLDTLHAGRRLGAADTAAHYEHTGAAVADVAAGEDAHGIWIAGALRPGVTAEQVAALQASPLSGDWRRIGGAMELVAALAVNSGGFPIPRVLVAAGAVQALQASGVVAPADAADVAARFNTLPDPAPTMEARRLLSNVIDRERRDEEARRAAAEDAHRRVLVASARAKVRR